MAAAPLQITRHGETISVSRFLVARALPPVGPVFCANRRNYLREKIAKNAILLPFFHPFVLSALCSLSLSLFPPLPFLFILLSAAPKPPCERKYTRNDTSFSRGFLLVLCYSSFIGTNITGTGYKSHRNDSGQEC